MKLTGTNRPITYTTHPSRERIQKTFTPGEGTKKQDCLRPLCGSQPTNPLLEEHNTGTNHNQHHRCCNTTDFPTPRPRGCGGGARVTAVIAWGKRPVPFRTRKLRPAAPMVLHPGGCGRVGHRRNTIQVEDPNHQVGVLPALTGVFRDWQDNHERGSLGFGRGRPPFTVGVTASPGRTKRARLRERWAVGSAQPALAMPVGAQ